MSQWVPTSHASLFLESKFVLQRLKSPISWSSSRRSKSARSSHQKNTWSLISRAAIMLIMLIRRRKRASNNVWPARPHGDLSQRRLFTFSATKDEYVIHVHCISINLALLPPTTYSWEATADNADLLELGQGPTVTVVIPLFLSFVVDRFPFDYFRGGGPHLSIAQLATDGYRSEKCPCQVSSDGFSYFAPNERYL